VVAQAINCSVLNCKESDTLQLSDIRTSFVVTQSNGSVLVQAQLGQSANLLTRVRPSGTDRLTASLGSQAQELLDTSGERLSYAASFTDAGEQPSVVVRFQRGSDSYGSAVTMPKPFSVLSPAAPVSLGRSSTALPVRLSLSSGPLATATMKLRCNRGDGTSFSGETDVGPVEFDSAAPGGGVYRLSPGRLDAILNEYSKGLNGTSPNLSAVTSCELDLVWTQTINGTTASALSGYSVIQATRSASHKISYDARL
jgi:hypothetical protein